MSEREPLTEAQCEDIRRKSREGLVYADDVDWLLGNLATLRGASQMTDADSATPHWTDDLVQLNACPEAVAWAHDYPSLADAWAACPRGDWMLWLAGQLSATGGDLRRAVVRAACLCAETAQQHWTAETAPACGAALTAARAWADDPTKERRHTAADAAVAATRADAAAAVAATCATCAATASYAACAVAAYTATYASTSAYAACAAAAYTARVQNRVLTADIVRSAIPYALIEERYVDLAFEWANGISLLAGRPLP